jgi:hypothetical protein
MYFTDTHVQILSKGLFEPGEQLVSRSVVVDAPWYTFGIWLFHKTYLVLATNQRLVMVEHSRDFLQRGMKTDKVHSIAWNHVSEMKVKGLLFKKKLRIVAQSNMHLFKGKMKIPAGFMAPIKHNVRNARVLEQQWIAIRPHVQGLPPGPSPSMAPQMPPQMAMHAGSHPPQPQWAGHPQPAYSQPPQAQPPQAPYPQQGQPPQAYGSTPPQPMQPTQAGPGSYYPRA